MSNPNARNPPSWLTKAQIMRAEGWPNRRIATAVRACHHSVRLWLDRYPPGTEIPLIVEAPAPEWVDEAKRLRAGGMSWEAIGVAVGAKPHTIRMAIDQVFHDQQRAKQKKARERTARMREDLAPIPMPEKPKASAGMLAASRFYNPADRRAGR